jgi:urease accessory protein
MIATNLTPRTAVLRATARQIGDKTVLTERYHEAPLKIAKSIYEEDSGRLCIYIMDVSPGLLDGDRYELKLHLENNAHLILTNQSFAKIHPTPLQSAEMIQSLYIGKDAILEYFPEPTIPYAGSRFIGQVKVHLGEEAIFLYADIVTPGRTHRGELFQYESFSNRLEVYRQDRLIAWDQFHLEPSIHDYRGLGAMEHYTHSGTFWVFAEQAGEPLLERLCSLLPQTEEPSGILAAASLTAEQGLVVRMLSTNVWQLQKLVKQLWDECRVYLWDMVPCRIRM